METIVVTFRCDECGVEKVEEGAEGWVAVYIRHATGSERFDFCSKECASDFLGK